MSTWDTELTDFSDAKQTLINMCCASCQMAHMEANLDGGECGVGGVCKYHCCGCLLGPGLRERTAQKYGIEYNAGEAWVLYCVGPCLLNGCGLGCIPSGLAVGQQLRQMVKQDNSGQNFGCFAE
eukprot:NODE_7353_length_573_cov_3.780534_g6341_i0.p1 GENE.NODE_7353_length_573_cov_3.780534_g6341_i0~~NODE_7353_length_573_cov_3.780534_g6341_i0.p1  ORF type:complete len:124 (+),score=41.00 NODE_7353_length_573_cov_3.780534_g6341_i0:96-467(+)